MARTVDTLYVAMTRPTMRWGVVFEGFVANAVFTFAVTVFVVHSPPGFLMGIGIHFGLRELCRVDPHFFGKWTLFFQTKAKSLLTWGTVGGSRLQPTPTRIHKSAEMRSCV